uniref:DUF2512 domain-containing protein n=1 Tax=Anaerobacillus isosaccharinicus TaxID=1532552 RepID=A0A1S2LEC3_9BACI|nr:DUF2512 family protein [Anaerobacillus isosaccharinicus]MBA5586543.1 DUF2512 family protein [Anaerobacillus isosaccharinicus]QOY38711.1 DUF2512 family protein [Anaerobacillus isosaccharinicus]
MRHFSAILMKIAMVTIVLLIVMTTFGNYPAQATIGLALVIAVVSFVVGDLAILRIFNNTVATIADLGLTTFVIWIFGPFFYGFGVPISLALTSAVVMGIGEWFFHKYMTASVIGTREPVSER